MKAIKGHLVYNCTKVNENKYRYHYSLGFYYEFQFHVIEGNSVFKNHGKFVRSWKHKIASYLEEKENYLEFEVSERCLSLNLH